MKLYIENRYPFIFLIISLIRFVSPFQSVYAQSSDPAIELASRIETLAENAPPELAYIQTNKDIYETGEDLWFKVYLLDSKYLTPSILSQTLYLQLLNERTGKAVWEEKYEILNGFSDGRVYINSTLPEGYYLLAAYTPNSFFGDSSEFKALKRVEIRSDISLKRNIQKDLKGSLTVRGDTSDLQFSVFPEGGEIVSGIQSKIAFKAVNISGYPVDIDGTLFEDSVAILRFKSLHAGMGSFEFMPDNSKKYYIRLTVPATNKTYLMPEIAGEGMAIKLERRDDEFLNFRISQSPGLQEQDVYIRVQCRGIVYGMATGHLVRELRIKLPVEELPQGIAEVTLFNSGLKPVAERLVYTNPDRKLNITATLSRDVYAQRGKAALKINVKDESGRPVIANLGVSIFDKAYLNPGDSSNILSHFYLAEQLRGRIYNPSYYFNSDAKERDEALDLLLLTQGWRRYIWSEANLAKYVEKSRQVINDYSKGEIYYPYNTRKIPKEETFVMAFSPNRDSTKVIVQADSVAAFYVTPELLAMWENDYVYLKPYGHYESKRPKKIRDPLALPEYNFYIRLKDPFETINRLLKSDEVTYPLPGLSDETEETGDQYSSEAGVIRIKEVTIRGQKARTIRGKYLGSLDSLTKVDADADYVCRFGVLNCPRHDRYEPGTERPVEGRQYAVIYEYNTQGERTRIITYWRPKYSDADLMRINNLWRVKAYYGHRQFYQPDYDRNTGEDSVPDFRNTLLWNPSVFTDENGEATLSFFCSDINTDFTGRIEGVSDDGLLGAGYIKFTVRKLKQVP